jgi:RimJ/RimL family protein N-acetyltransferase
LYLVEMKHDRAPMGVCGLVKRDGLEDIDIGFALMPPYREAGYGFEAAVATLQHAKADLGLKRVVAITSPENVSSMSLLKKLGLRFEKMVRPKPDAPEVALFATVSTTIRAAQSHDADALASLAERTFRDTYAAENTAADMDAHVARSFSPMLQAAELRDPQMSTIVAETDNGALAGYAQLRAGPAPLGIETGALEIWRFYVDKAHHGQGLAQQLMAATFDDAAKRGANAMWLGVWERNWRARAFYAKCGFKDIGTQTFVLGTDPQTDRVLVAVLT